MINTFTDFFIRARENEIEHSALEEDTHEEKTVKVCWIVNIGLRNKTGNTQLA